jgi:hypothetical protein
MDVGESLEAAAIVMNLNQEHVQLRLVLRKNLIYGGWRDIVVDRH